MIWSLVAAWPCGAPSIPPRGRAAFIGQCSKGGRAVPQLMFDSDDPAVLELPIFNDSRVATYADLLTPAIVAKFGRRLAVIDRGHGDPLNLAHIVDVERGALTIEQGAAKIRQWVSERRPWVTAYVNRSNRDTMKAALGSVDPFWWVATLDGTMNVQDSYTALVQFAGEAAFGLHVDVSVVYHTGWNEFVHLTDLNLLASVQANARTMLSVAQALAGQAQGL